MTTTLSSPSSASPAAGAGDPTIATWSSPPRTGRRVLIWAAAVVIVLGTAGWSLARWTQSGRKSAAVEMFTVKPKTFTVALKEKGELKAVNSTDIKCEVEGRSTIISLVAEGTAVEEGDLLVELASDQIDERIQAEELKESNSFTSYEAAVAELDIQKDRNASDERKAELEIRLKELELKRYEEGDWQQQLKDHKVAIEQAKIMLKRRDDDYEAAKVLKEKNFITQTEFEEDEFNFRKAEWDLDKAERALKVLEEYIHVAELAKRQSDLDEAIKECDRVKRSAAAEETKKTRAVEGKKKELDLTRDKLAKLRAQKEKCRITAPNPGFVVYYSGGGWRWGSDDQIKEGATVYERQVLMQLPDTSQMMIVVRIHEAKTDKIKIGQAVTVEVEGVPDKQFTGKVTKIAVVADSQNRWLNPDLKEYETEITLDTTDEHLKPGVTAHAEVLVETLEDVLAVPVQSVFTKGGARYVFRDTGGQVEPVGVQLGSVATEWAEIRDGLSEGDEIRLAVSDELKRLLPEQAPQDRRPSASSDASKAKPSGSDVKAKVQDVSAGVAKQGGHKSTSSPKTHKRSDS